MLIEMGAVTINVAEVVKLWSAVASAVIVTVLPTIMGNVTFCKGTTNVVGEPGGECVPRNEEVQSTPPQLAFQSTPALDGSPVTVAATLKLPPDGKDGGGS